ncbi:ATP-binding protein [Sphaerimonospora cavernae]|uniref:ATP-binding protein n=1 Tax=Sphaerimonospora cavernae TaxID=1740611 RepID=A0ABV6U5B3_9ACTN
MLDKPERIFDREFEWRHLSAFAGRAHERPQLGVISGRRRQGKTFLVEALARETGGFYFGATEATETESLRLFSDALADYADAQVPMRFASWDEAIRQLFLVGADRRRPLVIDEFPYLSKVSPALPSIIQREIDRAVSSRAPVSLLLCGSAMSVMGGLLSGSAPLRGRASLELVVRPFDYPLAARYWRIDDPRLGVLTHAVVGGTPAYLRFVNDDIPAGLDDFDDWVQRTVLDPGTPLFREARYLLEEEADVRDSALYHSVLAAVAAGNGTRGGIAGYIGRKAADIGHHLNVLEDSCLLRKEADVFRQGRSIYRVCEPLITFYQMVMRPQWGLLESGRARSVWLDARTRFRDQVIGPHFEQLCREFARVEPVFGELPGEVGAGVVADPSRRSQIQVDVVVFAPAVPGQPHRVLALGEVKWGKRLTLEHAARLQRARELLAAKGLDVRDTVLACFSGAGFDPALRTESGVRLIGLEDLYPPRA